MKNPKYYLLLQLIFFIPLILAMTFIDLPGNTKFLQELQNTGHTFAFGFAALFSLRLLRRANWIKSKSAWHQYIVVFCLCLFAGITVELLQLLTHRDADINDVVRDIAGIIAFLGFYSLIDRAIISPFRDNKTILLTSVAFTSIVMLVLALFPLSRLTYVYYQRHQAFPMLVDFESRWFNDFVTTTHAELAVVAAPDEWDQESGRSVARITLHQAKYPGFDFEEPPPDWSGFSNLNFKIFLTSPDEMALVIRIHDREHNQQQNDRFNHRIHIKHGENVVRIALESIRTAPAHRNMNMKEIAGVILFAVQPEKPLVFYLGNIWLD